MERRGWRLLLDRGARVQARCYLEHCGEVSFAHSELSVAGASVAELLDQRHNTLLVSLVFLVKSNEEKKFSSVYTMRVIIVC